MLSWIVTRFRFFGTITLVALYAICVVMPPAMAFPSGRAPAHCLTDDHHRIANVRLQYDIHGSIHVLGDRAIDKHADNSMNGKLKCHAGACCGLFCCAAINSGTTIAQPVQASLLFGVLDERLDGHGPKRIGRPPKSFLSL